MCHRVSQMVRLRADFVNRFLARSSEQPLQLCENCCRLPKTRHLSAALAQLSPVRNVESTSFRRTCDPQIAQRSRRSVFARLTELLFSTRQSFRSHCPRRKARLPSCPAHHLRCLWLVSRHRTTRSNNCVCLGLLRWSG